MVIIKWRNSIYKSYGNSSNGARSDHGTSITELLVAVVVMGIAVAGICEASWLNWSWSNLVQHKMDNQYSCKVFLSQLGKELEQASYVYTQSNGTYLAFFMNHKTYGDIKVEYTVDNAGSIAKKISSAPAITNVIVPSHTVLSGVIGPIISNTGSLSIFGYVDLASNNGKAIDQASANTQLVLIDLNMNNNNYANNRGAFGGQILNKSAYSVHREFFLRGSNLHGT